MPPPQKHWEIFCPTKLNLFLHVIGRKQDGYHLLESLVCFGDFGDTISFHPSETFQFTLWQEGINTPLQPDQNNLVIKAVNAFELLSGIRVTCHIHLNKRIPLGAGLGGGSSNAAGTIKGLEQYYNITLPDSQKNELLIKLGADVPVCYTGKSSYFSGVGETLNLVKKIPPLYAVILHPHIPCSTADIFQKIQPPYRTSIAPCPEHFETTEELLIFLQTTSNDLTSAAIANLPVIRDMLNILEEQKDCLLYRMSGSGSACFGLFAKQNTAMHCAEKIRQAIPSIWVQACALY